MDVGGVRARYEAQVRGRVPEWPPVGAVVERDGPLVRTHYGTHGTVEHPPLPARVPDLDALVLRQREAFAARSEPARWNVYGTEWPALAGALAAAGFVPGPERSLLAAEFARLTPDGADAPDGRRSGVRSLNSGTEDPAWWVAARELAAASGPHAKGLAEFEADGGPSYGRADAAVLLDERARAVAAGWAERVPRTSFVSVGGLTGPHPELLRPWQVLGEVDHVTGPATHYVAEAAGDLRTALLAAGFGELTTVRTFRWDPPGTPAPVRPVRQLFGELHTGPVWERMEREFGFRPSTTRFPGFDAPAPSVTWSLDALDQGGDERLDALDRIAQRALRAVTVAVTGPELGPGDGRTLYWLDWQHIGYAFDPHRVGGPGRPEWPGAVYPNGDYYLYLDPELRFGTLGHPWEHTLCVFGAPLLAEAEAELTALLGEPVRRRD